MLPAFAAEAKSNANPVLIVNGISEFTLVDSNEQNVFPLDNSQTTSLVTKVLPSVAKFLVDRDSDALMDSLIPAFQDWLSPLTCNPDGSVADHGVHLKYQFKESVAVEGIENVNCADAMDKDLLLATVDAVGAEKVYVYGLDWRLDPLVIADEINEYVQHIKVTTGYDKVSIAAISMGGVMVSAYLAKYGYADVSNVTMISSAFTGVDMVGELFCKRVVLDEEGAQRLIDQLITVPGVAKVIEMTGLLKQLVPLLGTVIEEQLDRVYDEVLIPIFAYNPSIWSFVADDVYEEAKQTMLAGADPSFEGVIDNYHYNVQSKIGDILKAAKASGVKVAIVSNYNLQIAPITPKANYSADTVIETRHTSGFATVANLGTVLAEEEGFYEQAVESDKNYLSSDGIIDASTCLLPDNTWFIKDMYHVGFDIESNNNNIYIWLMTADKQMDIDSNPLYPQFNIYEEDIKLLHPLDMEAGDVNHDGYVDLIDARQVLRYSKGLCEFDELALMLADFNGDKEITEDDATAIMYMVARLA
jgi:pimeloyl-ACP methyl ester carboxylesterase